MPLNRIKTWLNIEELTAVDLNAEFDNIINGMTPANINDISGTVTEMRLTQDPGGIGSENLPTSIKEEILELRSMIAKITGGSQWYEPPVSSLSSISSSLGLSTKTSGPVSGLVDANGQPQFLQAIGTAAGVSLKATTEDFVFKVAGVDYTTSLDQNLALEAGPSATEDEATIYDNQSSYYKTGIMGGELKGSVINLEDSTGLGSDPQAEIINRLGEISLFKTVIDGEFLLGVPWNIGSKYNLRDCKRGFLFNSSLSSPRENLELGSPIEILKLHWIFINVLGTLNKTVLTPLVQADTPIGPSSNQYWFDTSEKIWNVYDGAQWVDSQSALIGIAGVDSTDACICARSIDFISNYTEDCDVSLRWHSNSKVVSAKAGLISNYGSLINLYGRLIEWDMASDLDSGVTEAASKNYFCYIDSNFQPKISDVPPNDRQEDLRGWYHPYKPWRCIGGFFNDGSSNISPYIYTYGAQANISDSSISTQKLMPYHLSTFQMSNNLNLFDDGDVVNLSVSSIQSSDSTSPLVTITNGRPLLVALINGVIEFDGQINADLRINVNAVPPFPGVNPDTYFQEISNSSADVMKLPLTLFHLDMSPHGGAREVDMDLSYNSGAGSVTINGTLVVFEL